MLGFVYELTISLCLHLCNE